MVRRMPGHAVLDTPQPSLADEACQLQHGKLRKARELVTNDGPVALLVRGNEPEPLVQQVVRDLQDCSRNACRARHAERAVSVERNPEEHALVTASSLESRPFNVGRVSSSCICKVHCNSLLGVITTSPSGCGIGYGIRAFVYDGFVAEQFYISINVMFSQYRVK